jgi:hypothetical protein
LVTARRPVRRVIGDNTVSSSELGHGAKACYRAAPMSSPTAKDFPP